jgi:hypothetical protein
LTFGQRLAGQTCDKAAGCGWPIDKCHPAYG